MPGNDSDLGVMGERFALERLRKEGYRILETNFRAPGGEIDIVAIEKGTICFVEVKARRSESSGSPEEAVDRRKIGRIVRAAGSYRSLHGLFDVPVRFDVVALRVDEHGGFDAEITRGAFYEDGWG